ncbi:MAG: diaminopimelate epimerase [Arenicella sp.]|jgi:diaminopimelate epimerase
MKFQIIKCHGSENDFVMIDEVSNQYDFTEKQRVTVAQSLCNRSSQVGADGILYFLKNETGNYMMRMFNPDGSEAIMCGNGIRCIGRLASEVLGKEEMEIDTLGGIQFLKKETDLAEKIPAFSVRMEQVNINPNSLPLNTNGSKLISESLPDLSEKREFTAVSLGNPHLVSFVEKVGISELTEVGKKANSNQQLLPKGVNMNFCQLLNPNSIYVGTFERGAGITNSCGTGMSASTLASCLNNHVPFGEWINVYNAGGMVKCKGEQDENGKLKVHLLGNATYVYVGDIEMEEDGELSISNKVEFEEENKAYEQFKKDVKGMLEEV